MQKAKHTHKASRISNVSPDLSINLDESLHDNRLGFLVGEGISQTVADKDNQRKTFAGLVRTSRWLWSPSSGQFVQHPVLWSIESLHVFFRSSSLEREIYG